MATARVLPSGMWRCLVFVGMDESGKRKYKSFTASTKNEAELQAKLFLNDPSSKKNTKRITVKDAIDRYIQSKDGVLSPATIRGYKAMQKDKFESIKNKDIYKLTAEDMQKFVSETASKYSAKYTANIYGLLRPSVAMFRPYAVFNTTLPKKTVQRKIAPSNDDVQKLFMAADGELKICIALAAFGSLRRCEICGLKYGDVNKDSISIHADVVMDSDNNSIYKDMPKTSQSVRVIPLPAQVIKLIGTGNADDFVTHYTLSGLSNAYRKLRIELGIRKITLHDLRHYYASIGAVLGIPDIYVADFGGWKRGSPVLKQTYQDIMNDARLQFADTLNSHFGSLIDVDERKMQHEMQHEKRKVP